MSAPSEWAMDGANRIIAAVIDRWRSIPQYPGEPSPYAVAKDFAAVFDTMRATSARQAAEAHAEGFRAGIEAAAKVCDVYAKNYRANKLSDHAGVADDCAGMILLTLKESA